jgi:hypothetical protein
VGNIEGSFSQNVTPRFLILDPSCDAWYIRVEAVSVSECVVNRRGGEADSLWAVSFCVEGPAAVVSSTEEETVLLRQDRNTNPVSPYVRCFGLEVSISSPSSKIACPSGESKSITSLVPDVCGLSVGKSKGSRSWSCLREGEVQGVNPFVAD